MKNYTKYSVILCLTSILSSCAALEMISSILPSSSVPSISADLQVGDDKNTLAKTNNTIGDVEAEDNATVNLNTNTSDSHIDSAENVNIIEEGSPWWVYLLIIVPWFIISPQDIIRKFKNRKK